MMLSVTSERSFNVWGCWFRSVTLTLMTQYAKISLRVPCKRYIWSFTEHSQSPAPYVFPRICAFMFVCIHLCLSWPWLKGMCDELSQCLKSLYSSASCFFFLIWMNYSRLTLWQRGGIYSCWSLPQNTYTFRASSLQALQQTNQFCCRGGERKTAEKLRCEICAEVVCWRLKQNGPETLTHQKVLFHLQKEETWETLNNKMGLRTFE